MVSVTLAGYSRDLGWLPMKIETHTAQSCSTKLLGGSPRWARGGGRLQKPGRWYGPSPPIEFVCVTQCTQRLGQWGEEIAAGAAHTSFLFWPFTIALQSK